ncbi:MAG: hypothetical protein KIT34_05125 [Cyanobacteria bacterium TGS_CYA1]|nr:hypothetical protein [Cyanobacteria bacterium TGS_CYA1]
MVSDIKSQIIERYKTAREYSDKGSFEVKYSIANQEVKAVGKFATGYKRATNILKMKWSKKTKLLSDVKVLNDNIAGNDIFELKLGDGANLLHKGTEPKRLITTGKSTEMDLTVSAEGLLIAKIIPPLLNQDLFVESKINFDYGTEFDVAEEDEFFVLNSKNSPVKVRVVANRDLAIKEVTLQIGDWTSFFKGGPLAFARKHFEPMVHLLEKKIPSSLIGVYKYDQATILD